jgi:hypothetical protein
MSKTKSTTQGNQRINFSSAKGKIITPDFLDIQIESFREFFQLDTLPEARKMKLFTRLSRKISQLPIQKPIRIRIFGLSGRFSTLFNR